MWALNKENKSDVVVRKDARLMHVVVVRNQSFVVLNVNVEIVLTYRYQYSSL